MKTTGITAMRRCMMLCCLLVAIVSSRLFAQCTFIDNGHIFLHPYFNGGNWKAALFESAFIGSETMCDNKPVRLVFSGNRQLAPLVYTTGDGTWMYGIAPLEDNDCICCQPHIEYGDVAPVDLPDDITLDQTKRFHILNRGEADAEDILLIAVTSDDKVYAMRLNLADGSISSHEEIVIDRSGGEEISGIWGAPDNRGIDTAVWIGGSGGLLYLVQYSDGVWQSPQSVSLGESETVTSIGGAYLGTSSGKIYRRQGATFNSESAVANAAIRFITSDVAVGDNGTIVCKRNNVWAVFSGGETDYRYAAVSAGTNGTLVELLDDSWNYTVKELFDEKTTIDSVWLAEFAEYLDNGVYNISSGSISISLSDNDGNYQLPEVSVHSNDGDKTVLIDDNSDILSANPAALCIDGNTYFNDSLVSFTFGGGEGTLHVVTKKSIDNTATCGFWKWEKFLYERSVGMNSVEMNGEGTPDTLFVTLGTDTLKIIATYIPTVAVTAMVRKSVGLIGSFRQNRFYYHTDGNKIYGLCIFDVSGRLIWKARGSLSGSIVSPILPKGVYYVKGEHADHSIFSQRIVSTGR